MTILERRKTLGTQLIEIMSEIEENWQFNGQLRINLHKSKTKDYNEKDAEIWGWCWSFSWIELHKIGSLGLIRGVIERN